MATEQAQATTAGRPKPGARLTDAERDMADANRGLVYAVAKSMRLRWRLDDDAIQAGMRGLMRAVQLYNPATGYQFGTYAGYWIRQAIQRHMTSDRLIHIPAHAQRGKLFREEVGRAMRPAKTIARRGDGLAENEPWARDEEPDDETIPALRAAIARLDPRSHEVITRRMRGETLKAIGAAIGLTRERVRQIEHEVHGKLREMLKDCV